MQPEDQRRKPEAASAPSVLPSPLPKRPVLVAWRVVASLTATCGLFALWAVGLALVAWLPRPRAAWRRAIFSAWGRSLCKLCGVRLVVIGRAPDEGAFLVCNHLSFVDIWVLAATTGGRFVSMAEVARWPLIGFMARCLGTIFIRRERRRDIPEVNRQIARALESGDTVLVFPEGGNSQGESVRPFKPSLLEPVAANGHAVAWATLRYDTHDPDVPASWAVCWVRSAFAAQLMRLLSLPAVEARIVFGAGREHDGDRKQLAARLERHVAAAFTPMAPPPDGWREAPIAHGLARGDETA